MTGGAGYIGSHCALALVEQGYKVVIADCFSNSHPESVEKLKSLCSKLPNFHSDSIIFVHVDLATSSLAPLDSIFLLYNIQAVIHLAAHKSVPESIAKPLLYYQNNLCSLLNVLQHMEKHNVHRIIFSSSATVYGTSSTPSSGATKDEPGGELTEESPCAPTNPYGMTKWWGEQIIRDTCKAWKASFPKRDVCGIALRYMNPYGLHSCGQLAENPRGTPNNLYPIIMQVVSGQRDSVTVFGSDYETRDGTGERDYVHVVDVASAHVKMLDKMLAASLPSSSKEDKGEEVFDVINVGTGRGKTVLELVAEVQAQFPENTIPVKMAPRRPGDIASLVVNIDKAKRVGIL